MADIAKSGTPTLASLTPPQCLQHAGLKTGAAVAAGDACYIKGSDGLVYPATGAAVNAAAKVRGFAAEAASSGDPVTLLFDVVFAYGSGLTPGADYYLSGATAGALADAASTGGTAPIGYAVDATRIAVFRSAY